MARQFFLGPVSDRIYERATFNIIEASLLSTVKAGYSFLFFIIVVLYDFSKSHTFFNVCVSV